MINYRHFTHLLSLAQQLELSRLDSLKLLANYYFSRLGTTRTPCFVFRLSRGGKTLQVPLRPNGTDYTVLVDVFVKQLYKIRASNVRTIVDLGANIGLATLYLKTLYPDAQVACVEPFPDNVDLLTKTLRLNHIEDARVFAAAIGTDDGAAVLKIGSDSTDHSLVPAVNARPLSSIEVPQISCASLLERLGWANIDLLKVDIEGYEKTLFSARTEWLDRTRYIVGEAHAHVGYGLSEVQRDLSRHGFTVREQHRDPAHGLIVFTASRDLP